MVNISLTSPTSIGVEWDTANVPKLSGYVFLNVCTNVVYLVVMCFSMFVQMLYT